MISTPFIIWDLLSPTRSPRTKMKRLMLCFGDSDASFLSDKKSFLAEATKSLSKGKLTFSRHLNALFDINGSSVGSMMKSKPAIWQWWFNKSTYFWTFILPVPLDMKLLLKSLLSLKLSKLFRLPLEFNCDADCIDAEKLPTWCNLMFAAELKLDILTLLLLDSKSTLFKI